MPPDGQKGQSLPSATATIIVAGSWYTVLYRYYRELTKTMVLVVEVKDNFACNQHLPRLVLHSYT